MTDASTDFTPNLSLPFLLPSQAQKHVTVNETLAALDTLVMGSVIAVDASDPPTDLASGDAFLLSSAPTGVWAGHAGTLAAWVDGAWTFYTPKPGWRVWDASSETLLVFQNGVWSPLNDNLDSVSELGINTDPDSANRLAVKSDAVLLSHDDITPGTGDMRVAVNKQAGANTASLIFQSGYSARGEIGLTGDEDLSFRVSPDGTDWSDCLRFDPVSGHAGMGAPPDAENRLRVEGQLKVSGATGQITHKPNGTMEFFRENAGTILLRSFSAGSRLNLGVTDSAGTLYSHAIVIQGDGRELLTNFTFGPLVNTTIDLGFSDRPFRDLYLTNAPTISSDKRGKQNIEVFDAGLELIQALNPVTFERPGAAGARHFGLIAQHVREVLEEQGLETSAIWTRADPDDEASQQAIAYGEFIPVLIDAVSELAERVEVLEQSAQEL